MSHPIQVGASTELKPGKNELTKLLLFDVNNTVHWCDNEASEETDAKFVAGNLRNNWSSWRALTSDPWILNCVSGMSIPLLITPVQEREPFPFKMDEVERAFVKIEVNNLLDKHVLKLVEEHDEQWVSNIFLRPKPNGKFRMILDLTELNKIVKYEHFKMFNLKTALDLIEPGMWMASADLTDAYYSVTIIKSQRKLLRFRLGNDLLEYQVLPNGLSPGPRIFTKLLKPIYAKLGEMGYIGFPYLDDSFVIGTSADECKGAISVLVGTLKKLGFKVNKQKSVLTPTQCLTFLGFEIDSVRMYVSLTEDKKQKMLNVIKEITESNELKIRQVAGLIGLMVAYAPAVEYGGIHFKCLERDKIKALKRSKGNFEDIMWISERGYNDITWWGNNLDNPRKIRREEPDVELFTDASHQGWGAHTGSSQTGGRWHPGELTHINALELRAIAFGLKSLCRERNIHIRIRTDSTTALAYVKNMGGTKSEDCLIEAVDIWEWAQKQNNWLTITHIPGVENVLADLRSRKFKDHLEWSLSEDIFKEICKTWGTPEIDMFASRLNAKITKYVSWEPEPDNWRTDAFSIKWSNMYIYCFPPFSLLPRVVRKIQKDQTTAIVVAPHWPAQPWHPLLQGEARDSREFPRDEGNLVGTTGHGSGSTEEGLSRTRLTAYLF